MIDEHRALGKDLQLASVPKQRHRTPLRWSDSPHGCARFCALFTSSFLGCVLILANPYHFRCCYQQTSGTSIVFICDCMQAPDCVTFGGISS